MSEDCDCGFTKDGQLFICPKHYRMMKENSEIRYG